MKVSYIRNGEYTALEAGVTYNLKRHYRQDSIGRIHAIWHVTQNGRMIGKAATLREAKALVTQPITEKVAPESEPTA